jgi:hypothetical protein
LPNGLSSQRGSHQVNHQCHGQQAVEHESDDGAQDSALGAECLGQGHEQGDVKPGNDYQVHLFWVCNLGDNNLEDTLIQGIWKKMVQETFNEQCYLAILVPDG